MVEETGEHVVPIEKPVNVKERVNLTSVVLVIDKQIHFTI